MDKIKRFGIRIEKDGHNESVYGSKKYRLYICEELLMSSDYFKDIKERLLKILEASFG